MPSSVEPSETIKLNSPTPPMTSLWLMLRDQLTPAQLFLTVMAGLVSGLIGVLFDTSFAAFIFRGDLERFLPVGVGIVLLSTIIARLTGVIFSSFPTLTIDIDDLSTTILAISTAGITAQLVGGDTQVLLSTVLVTIALTTCLTVIFLLTLGQVTLLHQP